MISYRCWGVGLEATMVRDNATAKSDIPLQISYFERWKWYHIQDPYEGRMLLRWEEFGQTVSGHICRRDPVEIKCTGSIFLAQPMVMDVYVSD